MDERFREAIELMGGVLQQSNISTALKVLCALAFLYCLPVIFKNITSEKIILTFASVLLILFNYLMFSNEQLVDTLITFFSMCFTGFMAVDSLKDFSLLKRYLVKTSRIIGILGTLVVIMSITGIVSSLRLGTYSMGLGYACITCVMFLAWNFLREKKPRDLICAVGLLTLIFVYCSRGPLVGIILFTAYFGIRYFHDKGHNLACVLIVILMAVVVAFYSDILNILFDIFDSLGVTSRNIRLLAAQSFNYDAGRNTLWDKLIDEIQRNPFRLRGINAEYAVIGTYAHNLIIELVYQHGVVIGGLFLFFIFAKIIDTLKLNMEEDMSVICLIFMFAIIPSLMFSGSLWIAQNFWIWLAMILRVTTIRRKNHQGS